MLISSPVVILLHGANVNDFAGSCVAVCWAVHTLNCDSELRGERGIVASPRGASVVWVLVR